MKKQIIALSLLLVGFGATCTDPWFRINREQEDYATYGSIKKARLYIFDCPGHTIHPNGTQDANGYYIYPKPIKFPTSEEIKANPTKSIVEFRSKLFELFNDCPCFTSSDLRNGNAILGELIKQSEELPIEQPEKHPIVDCSI